MEQLRTGHPWAWHSTGRKLPLCGPSCSGPHTDPLFPKEKILSVPDLTLSSHYEIPAAWGGRAVKKERPFEFDFQFDFQFDLRITKRKLAKGGVLV